MIDLLLPQPLPPALHTDPNQLLQIIINTEEEWTLHGAKEKHNFVIYVKHNSTQISFKIKIFTKGQEKQFYKELRVLETLTYSHYVLKCFRF